MFIYTKKEIIFNKEKNPNIISLNKSIFKKLNFEKNE